MAEETQTLTDWIPATTPPMRRGWYDLLLHDSQEIRRVLFTGLEAGLWVVHDHELLWSGEKIDTSWIVPIHQASWRGLAQKPNAELSGAPAQEQR